MRVRELSERYPKLWHMAEDGSWPGIRRHGLLSTTALLDLYGVEGEERRRIESHRRPEIVPLDHPELGASLVRDNKPLQERSLEKCLEGMTPGEWYETLNRRVFFWVTRDRLLKLLGAKPYRDRPHLVLEIETAALLERHPLPDKLRCDLRYEPGPAWPRHVPAHRRPPGRQTGGRARRGLRHAGYRRPGTLRESLEGAGDDRSVEFPHQILKRPCYIRAPAWVRDALALQAAVNSEPARLGFSEVAALR